MKVSCLLLVLAVVSASSASPVETQWEQWKEQHGKSYLSGKDEFEKKMTWATNAKFIEDFNKEGHSYTLGTNHFTDVSPGEFKSSLMGSVDLALLRNGASSTYSNRSRCDDDCVALDWRNEGFTPEMLDQGYCQSSWAFSAAGAIDGQYFVMTGDLLEISIQQLLDCSSSCGNRGCHGGIPTWAYKYIEGASGVCTTSKYPYLGYTWYCAEKFCSKSFTCTGFSIVETGSEQDLMGAVTDVGPISVVVDAAPLTFQFYSGGVYDDSNCRTNSLNHAMLLVGYGVETDTGYAYWVLKNSWGSDWGMDGYMYLARNKNNLCGIATAASYPLLKQI